MSKQIDWSQPLTEEERAWAEQFPGLHGGMLEANAQQFPPKEDPSLDGEDEVIPPYKEWKLAELTDEATRRNSEDGKALPTTGTKAVMIKALEDDDAASA